MWERNVPIARRTPDDHWERRQLLHQQRLAEVLFRDAGRLLEQITDLLPRQPRDGRGTGYRLLPDPDDPDRGDLARQIAARRLARRLAAPPPEDDGGAVPDAMPCVWDGPPS